MNDSEDESSDSSNDFLVPAGQLNLNSHFFDNNSNNEPKPKSSKKVKRIIESSDTEEDEFDEIDNFKSDTVDDAQSAQIFSQILQNLQNSKNPDGNKEEQRSNLEINTKGESLKSEGLASEINDLLLQGENGITSSIHGRAKVTLKEKEKPENEEEEKEEEEVKPETSSGYVIPKEGVQITLPGSGIISDMKKKKIVNLETLLRNKLNQRIRSTQLLVHKVGLLWWFVHGFHLNRLSNDCELLATCLSLVTKNDYPKKGRVDLIYVERITNWVKKTFPIVTQTDENPLTVDTILERIREKKVHDYRQLVVIFVSLARAMGLQCRLVVSLCPPPMKPRKDQLLRMKEEKDESNEKSKLERSKGKDKKRKGAKSKKGKKVNVVKIEETKKIIPANSPEGKRNAQIEARNKAAAILKKEKVEGDKSKSRESLKMNSQEESKVKSREDSEMKVKVDLKLKMSASNKSLDSSKQKLTNKTSINEDSDSEESRKNNERLLEIQKNRKLISSDDEEVSKIEEVAESSDDEKEVTIASKLRKRISKFPVRKLAKYVETSDDDSDEDFDLEETLKNNKRNKGSRKMEIDYEDSNDDFEETRKSGKKKASQRNQKSISLEDEEQQQEEKDVQDVWAEVYVDSEKNWISVSVLSGKVNCINYIYRQASNPVLYIIAYNSGGSVKDVTRRYCPNWLTVTRKQRVDETWWSESLKPWKEKNTAMSKDEDEMLLQKELERPLPKTVSECKGHPLYALVRHLLKYEALYPPDSAPLGYLKNGEAIYSRYCVHTLRSRETWVKHARVVKPAQEPYKIVTAMPKYDKFTGTRTKGLPLELFGKWQTTPYIPPEAKDGIVPRNEYGNVDLFKMCMLPKGTVYINLPGLNRIARKLNIDCAPAVVGFNFKSVGAVPAFEGFVVCSEFEDTLREAWEEEQVEAVRRSKERREKRIYGNWRKLINGLLIRQRLAAKYSLSGTHQKNTQDEKPGPMNETVVKGKKSRLHKEVIELDDEEVRVKKPRLAKTKVLERKQESKSKRNVKERSENNSVRSRRSRIVKKEDSESEYEEDEDEEDEEERDFEIKVKKSRRSLRPRK